MYFAHSSDLLQTVVCVVSQAVSSHLAECRVIGRVWCALVEGIVVALGTIL